MVAHQLPAWLEIIPTIHFLRFWSLRFKNQYRFNRHHFASGHKKVPKFRSQTQTLHDHRRFFDARCACFYYVDDRQGRNSSARCQNRS